MCITSQSIAYITGKIKIPQGNLYALLGFVAILIAIDLPDRYVLLAASPATKTPEWIVPLRSQFFYINMIVAVLVYLGSAAFAMALKKVDWFKPAACHIYIDQPAVFCVGRLTANLAGTICDPEFLGIHPGGSIHDPLFHWR